MDDINTIYYNDFGIAFQWKRSAGKDFRKIQLVFRDTGLFVTQQELIHFSFNVQQTLDNPSVCNDCHTYEYCQKMHLVQTPFGQITFAMTYIELEKTIDLIEGTIFQLRLDRMLENQSIDFNDMP